MQHHPDGWRLTTEPNPDVAEGNGKMDERFRDLSLSRGPTSIQQQGWLHECVTCTVTQAPHLVWLFALVILKFLVFVVVVVCFFNKRPYTFSFCLGP